MWLVFEIAGFLSLFPGDRDVVQHDDHIPYGILFGGVVDISQLFHGAVTHSQHEEIDICIGGHCARIAEDTDRRVVYDDEVELRSGLLDEFFHG